MSGSTSPQALGALAGLLLIVTTGVSACGSKIATSPASASPLMTAPDTAADSPLFRDTLARMNWYRAAAGVPILVPDPEKNEAAHDLAKYLVMNHIRGGDATVVNGRLSGAPYNYSAHMESPGNPFYTEDAERLARNAYVIRASSLPQDGAALTDQIMTDGFSPLSIVNPQGTAAAHGSYCAEGDCAMVLWFKSGLPKSVFLKYYVSEGAAAWNPLLGDIPVQAARLRVPVKFPAPGFIAPLGSDSEAFFPDPLRSCPTITAPSGLPVSLEFGDTLPQEKSINVSSYSISEDGTAMDACEFDSSNYKSPDGFEQTYGRRALAFHGGVVVVPAKPLRAGHQYTVSITADSRPYTWSFTVSAASR